MAIRTRTASWERNCRGRSRTAGAWSTPSSMATTSPTRSSASTVRAAGTMTRTMTTTGGSSVSLDAHPRQRNHRLGTGVDAERPVGRMRVLLDGVLGDAELARDLAVRETLGDELQHVGLAFGDAEVGERGSGLEVRHRAQGLRRHVRPAPRSGEHTSEL